MGRKLTKASCPLCGRLVSIMSNVTRNRVRNHKCDVADALCALGAFLAWGAGDDCAAGRLP